MKIPWPQPFKDGDVKAFLEDFEDAAEVAGVKTDRGKLAALRALLKGRAKAVLEAARRGPAQMEWAAAKDALIAGFDTAVDRQEAMRQFWSARFAGDADPLAFAVSLKRWLSRALPGMDEEAARQLLTNQFLEAMPVDVRLNLKIATIGRNCHLEELADMARVFMIGENPVAEVLESRHLRNEERVHQAYVETDGRSLQLPFNNLIEEWTDNQTNKSVPQKSADKASEQLNKSQETDIRRCSRNPSGRRPSFPSGTKSKHWYRRTFGKLGPGSRKWFPKRHRPYTTVGNREPIVLVRSKIHEDRVHSNQPSRWHEQKSDPAESLSKPTGHSTRDCWKPERLLLQITDFSPGEECCGVSRRTTHAVVSSV